MKHICNKTCRRYLQTARPAEWIGFLFDVQNALISCGYLEGMTRKGSEEFAGKFSDLKNFFEEIKISEADN